MSNDKYEASAFVRIGNAAIFMTAFFNSRITCGAIWYTGLGILKNVKLIYEIHRAYKYLNQLELKIGFTRM